MPALIKEITTEYIPPSPGTIYTPARPAYVSYETQTVCTNVAPPSSYVQDENGEVQVIQPVWATYQTCTDTLVEVYHEATAGSEYTPPADEQTIVVSNAAWDTYAKTIDRLLLGYAVEFTVKLGTHGALLAVGPAGMEGQPLTEFHYGIVVDTSGIYGMENGVKGTLLATNSPGLKIRITRLSNGQIAYTCNGKTVVSARSDYGLYEELYVYGLLYAAYDEVSTAEFIASSLIKASARAVLNGTGALTAKVALRVAMSGTGDLLAAVTAPAVMMRGYGALNAEFAHNVGFAEATLTGSGGLLAYATTGGRGAVTLEPMQTSGGDVASSHLGYGSVSLPLMMATGYEAVFVPAQPTSGFAYLPYLTAWGMGSTTHVGTGSVSLPLFQAQAAETAYGIGSVSLPLMRSFGSGGFIAEDELILLSAGVARSRQDQAIDLVLILNSDGTLSSSWSMTREQALALMSSLSQSSSFSMLGTFGMTVTSDLRVASLQALNVANRPDLFDGGAVWVVNLDTSASSQYESYGFNSFFQRGSDYYGVANDGIYKLAGDDDAGIPIAALVEFARSNLGSTHSKHVPEVYLAASSDGALTLKVVAEGGTHYYAARSSSADLRNHLVKPGKGLNSVYWQFALMNQNGDDFNVAGLEFVPAVSKRRI